MKTLPLLALGCIGCDDGVLAAFQSDSQPVASGLLDDFEDQDNQAGLDGWWYTTDDGTGPDAQLTFESVSDRAPSRYAARFRAGPTTDYGAFLGLDLPGGVYDASDFDTLSFAARADPALTLRIRLLDTLFVQYDTFVGLDGEWQQLAVPLSEFLREGVPLDPSRLTHLQLWVEGPSPAADFWIDDVWLTTRP